MINNIIPESVAIRFRGFVLYEAVFEYEHFIIKAVNVLFRFWIEWASPPTNGGDK